MNPPEPVRLEVNSRDRIFPISPGWSAIRGIPYFTDQEYVWYIQISRQCAKTGPYSGRIVLAS
jgi:hypothetical protein